MNMKNELFYVNITVDLLFDERINPTSKLWEKKNGQLGKNLNTSQV